MQVLSCRHWDKNACSNIYDLWWQNGNLPSIRDGLGWLSVFLIPWYISQAYSNNAIYHNNAEKILMMQSACMDGSARWIIDWTGWTLCTRFNNRLISKGNKCAIKGIHKNGIKIQDIDFKWDVNCP